MFGATGAEGAGSVAGARTGSGSSGSSALSGADGTGVRLLTLPSNDDGRRPLCTRGFGDLPGAAGAGGGPDFVVGPARRGAGAAPAGASMPPTVTRTANVTPRASSRVVRENG